MKKYNSPKAMLSSRIKKTGIGICAGVVVVSASIGSLAAFKADDKRVYSKNKNMYMSEAGATALEDNKFDVQVASYTDANPDGNFNGKARIDDDSTVELASAEDHTARDHVDHRTGGALIDTPDNPIEGATEEPTTQQFVFIPAGGSTGGGNSGGGNSGGGNSGGGNSGGGGSDGTTEEKKPTDGMEYLGEYTITAYCPCEKCTGKVDPDGITASGKKASPNHTIAAPTEFEFGTKLYIDGITYEVEDRGGAITGKRLDIYFDTHEEALAFPMGTYDVYRPKN